MKIIELRAQNIKRLSAISIRPDGNVVVLGGANGSGKTSALDCIEYGLASAAALPDEPVRKGASSGQIYIDLGDLKIETEIKNGKKNLVVRDKGIEQKSPQTLLDKLYKKCLDPLEFLRSEGKKQVALLKNLTGLDFSQLDAQIKELTEQRKLTNQMIKAAEGKHQLTAGYPDAPTEPVSPDDLIARIQKGQQYLTHLQGLEVTKNREEQAITEKKQQILKLEKEIAEHQDRIKQIDKGISELPTGPIIKQGLEQLSTQLKTIEEVNTQVRANLERQALETEIKLLYKQALDATAKIDEIEKYKLETLANTKFPVTGLTFNEEQVYFNGVPFNQCSSAEALRVSVAVGIACNPQLKVLIIRDGSLLDDNSLAAIAQMAEQYDFQVWIERVGTGEEVSVVIEDGMVKEDRMDRGGIRPAVTQ